MSGVLRVNAADPRIPNTGGWLGATNDHTLTCQHSGCQFFLLFRGTGIKIYGRTDAPSMAALYLQLDGYTHTIPLNGTTYSGGVVPIYGAENMGDGDHQLMGIIPFLTNGTVFIDHFEIENASGDGFDLLSAGSTAQNVPAQAVIVDNIDPAILHHNESQWSKYSDGVLDYGRSVSFTSTPGASLSFSFDGVAIWFYGHICSRCGSFKVSIDGLTPQRFNSSAYSNPYDLVQRMIWSNTNLDPGRHTLNITYDEDNVYSGVYLDFFRVLPGPSASTLLSSSSTTNLGELPTTVPPLPPTDHNQTNRVPLAVGLTPGLLVLVVVALCGVRCICRRGGRRPINPDAHSVSPYVPPIRRANQQSIIPQARKGVPQPAQSSHAPMAIIDRVMPSSVPGLGPPPSYETPSYDWRVDTAL